jgi:hypothetical protein
MKTLFQSITFVFLIMMVILLKKLSYFQGSNLLRIPILFNLKAMLNFYNDLATKANELNEETVRS